VAIDTEAQHDDRSLIFFTQSRGRFTPVVLFFFFFYLKPPRRAAKNDERNYVDLARNAAGA